jgi:hypothetical protein
MRGEGVEVPPVFHLHATYLRQAQIQLVDQPSRLKRVAGSLAPEVAGRNGAQFVVSRRSERPQRLAIAHLPAVQQPGNFTRERSLHGHEVP